MICSPENIYKTWPIRLNDISGRKYCLFSSCLSYFWISFYIYYVLHHLIFIFLFFSFSLFLFYSILGSNAVIVALGGLVSSLIGGVISDRLANPPVKKDGSVDRPRARAWVPAIGTYAYVHSLILCCTGTRIAKPCVVLWCVVLFCSGNDSDELWEHQHSNT